MTNIRNSTPHGVYAVAAIRQPIGRSTMESGRFAVAHEHGVVRGMVARCPARPREAELEGIRAALRLGAQRREAMTIVTSSQEAIDLALRTRRTSQSWVTRLVVDIGLLMLDHDVEFVCTSDHPMLTAASDALASG